MNPNKNSARESKKRITFLFEGSQNLGELQENLNQTSSLIDAVMQPSQGPRMQPSQIESKSGDSGDLFESGTLFNDESKPISSYMTQSGSLINPFCEHVYMTQEVEQKLFAQIKKQNANKFVNICEHNCRMKMNKQFSNVQKLLLYQLHENQAIMMKQEIQKKNQRLKVVECSGQGCDYYFIMNDKGNQNYFYCPLCLESFAIKQ